jgi:hypothetical protein
MQFGLGHPTASIEATSGHMHSQNVGPSSKCTSNPCFFPHQCLVNPKPQIKGQRKAPISGMDVKIQNNVIMPRCKPVERLDV